LREPSARPRLLPSRLPPLPARPCSKVRPPAPRSRVGRTRTALEEGERAVATAWSDRRMSGASRHHGPLTAARGSSEMRAPLGTVCSYVDSCCSGGSCSAPKCPSAPLRPDCRTLPGRRISSRPRFQVAPLRSRLGDRQKHGGPGCQQHQPSQRPRTTRVVCAAFRDTPSARADHDMKRDDRDSEADLRAHPRHT